MVVQIASLVQIASRFDAIVLDQFGVLHDGSTPYPDASAALMNLRNSGVRLAVLSNSGKRAAPNAARIAKMGFAVDLFEVVMTSGEALWLDIHAGLVSERSFFPIEGAKGDAQSWAEGLGITLVPDIANARAVLLMGLPDAGAGAAQLALDAAFARQLPVYCTNPDRVSPRADGGLVTSPGALAHAYADKGGKVQFYGKPHRPIFQAVQTFLGVAPDRILMVGDSLEHDIAGAAAAGWASALVEGGIHRDDFDASLDKSATVDALCRVRGYPSPDFTLPVLR